MEVKLLRQGVTRQGDDIVIRDNDNREIIIKRQSVKELIKQLRKEV